MGLRDWIRRIIGGRKSSAWVFAEGGDFGLIPRWQAARLYRNNELVYACIAAIAATASQVSLKIYERETGERADDHPARRLIARPNPHMNEYDFWAHIISAQKVFGRAAFEKERDRLGRLIGLWPLRPDYLRAEIGADGKLIGYSYELPGVARRVLLDARDVVDFPLPDVFSRYSPASPLEILSRSGLVDSSATDFLANVVRFGGVPPLIISVDGYVDEAMAQELRRRWREAYGGYRKWTDPAVIGEGARVERIGYSFDELGLDYLDARNETRICAVLGVPPIIVGAKAGLDAATYSNYEQARRSWWEDRLIPMYANLVDVIEAQILPEFGDADRYYAEFDFSRVPGLFESEQARFERAINAFRAGAFTLNEFYLYIGMGTIGPAGDVYLRPINVVETRRPARGGATFEPPRESKAEPDYIRVFAGADEAEFKRYLEQALDEQRRLIEAQLLRDYGAAEVER